MVVTQPQAHPARTADRPLLRELTRVLARREIGYVGALYLQRTVILLLVTLTIVVALDVSVNFQSVMSLDADEVGRDGFNRLVYYALLRLSFVSTSILFFVGVWGVVWSEYSLSRSGERIMIFNCGHSYLSSLVPALLLGVLIGALQFSITAFVKPFTVELEATTTHRQYGPKFERPIVTEPEWIAGNKFIVQAGIDFGDTVSLKQVYFYEFNERGSIRRIITAPDARYRDSPEQWIFRDARVRKYETRTSNQQNERFVVSDEQFDELGVAMGLNPLWLENYGVLPSLLPHRLVAALADDRTGVPDRYKYEMALQERYAGVLYCISTILLCAYLAMATNLSGTLPFRALGVALVGFGAFFLYSVALMLGRFGYVPVFAAAWSIPALAFTALAGLFFFQIRKVSLAFRGLSSR